MEINADTLSRNQIYHMVRDSIHEIVNESPKPEVNGDTDPIGHLGLDSYHGVDFACELSARLAWDIPLAVNPFVDDETHRSRSVDQIVDLILQLIREKE